MNLYFQNYSNSILPSYLYEVSAQVYHPSICFSFDPMLVKHSSDMPKNSILLVIFDINDISSWEEAKSFVEDNPQKNTIIIGSFENQNLHSLHSESHFKVNSWTIRNFANNHHCEYYQISIEKELRDIIVRCAEKEALSKFELQCKKSRIIKNLALFIFVLTFPSYLVCFTILMSDYAFKPD